MANETIASTIRAIKQGENIPQMRIIRDPVSAAVISKIVQDPNVKTRYDARNNRKPLEPDVLFLKQLSRSKMDDVADAETVMQLLPDLELSAQILISSILSPKDMMNVDLIYTPPETICPPHVAGSLIRIIKNYYSTNYKIESKLSLMLRDILYNTGSYAVCVIPENAIDEIINNNQRVSKEDYDNLFGDANIHQSLLKPKGVLGKPYLKPKVKSGFTLENYHKRESDKEDTTMVFTMEDLNYDFNLELTKDYDLTSYIQVTDNWDILSVPRLDKYMRERTISDILNNQSQEDSDVISDRDIDNLLFRRMYYQSNTLVQVKTNDQGYRKSIADPLVIHLPSESVIPVFIPGAPDEHVGYFVLIDETGNPVSKETSIDYYNELGMMSANNRKCLTSHLLDKAKDLYDGYATNARFSNRFRYDYAARAYADIVEKDLVTRLRNGIYGNNIKIGGSDEIFRIMFSRALMQQFTQMLFIPVELMTYMAFKFDENGMGQSLLDNLKIVNSLSISLMLANTRAAIMNSVPRTKVSVKLDEDTPNVEGVRESIMNEYMLNRSSNAVPVGTINPVDLSTWASQANVEFEWTGAKDLPDMSIDISEFSSQIPKSDTDLDDDLKKKRIMGQGLSPETVDASQSPDFATSIVQESLMHARRAMQYQQLYTPQLSDHIRKITLATPSLLAQLEEVLFNNFEEVIEHLLPERKDYQASTEDKLKIVKKATIAFVKQLEIELPKPNNLSIVRKKEAFDEYMEAVEKCIDYYISNNIMPTDVLGDLAEKADSVKSILIAHYARKWMIDNDYLTELNDLITLDEDDKAIFNVKDMAVDFAANMEKSIGEMLDRARPIKETGDIYMKGNDVEEGASDSSFSSDSSSDSDDSDDSSGDDFGDMGGFDMSFDEGDESSSDSEDGESDNEL